MEACVVIQDTNDFEVYGVLIVKDHTVQEVNASINDTMKAYDGEWCVEDLINNLPSEWDYRYIDSVGVRYV